MPEAAEAASVLGQKWVVMEPLDADITPLTSELGLNPLTARVLAARGYVTPDSADSFLNPSLDKLHDPNLLPDYEKARDILFDARDQKQRIFIHGDYDVDGVTSTALLARFLRRIDCDVVAHVPHRLKEGYGIHHSAVKKAQESGAKLFLTCDCGIAAFEQIKMAKELGMRVVVTDHHELQHGLPEADAIVNPHRTDVGEYPFPMLCGAGVAFKLCSGIAQEAGFKVEQFQRAFLDLVTLGTVADVMPLVDENRIIVKHGLPQLSSSKKVGIQALLQCAVPGHIPGNPLKSGNIGWQLGPRLNAAGRIDDSDLSLRLLMEEDPGVAKSIAERLEEINMARRDEQDRIIAEALAEIELTGQAEQNALVVAGDGWHPGIVGIVAGRLVDRMYRPSFAVAFIDGVARGSARSIPGYHLAEALHRVGHLLIGHGGHEMAAGFSCREEDFPAVREALHQDAMEHIQPEYLTRALYADAEAELHEFTLPALYDLLRLEPFGNENPEPTFVIRGAQLDQVSLTKNVAHVRFGLRDKFGKGITAMGWNFGNLIGELRPGMLIDAVVQASIDTYRGEPEVKLFIRDFASSP